MSGVRAGVDRRLDRWCAAALVTSAVLKVVYSSDTLARRASNVHLVRYSWVLALVEATVLIAVARSFATGRHRVAAAAFLVGFAAMTVFSVLFEVEFRLGIWSAGLRDLPDWLLWYSAAALQVAVAVRAFTMIKARPRQQLQIPCVFTAVVVLAVLVGVSAAQLYGEGVEPITGLLELAALGAIPIFALRHAEATVSMLCGLAASLALRLASRWLVQYSLPRGFRTGFYIETSLAILPAVVLLGALARVVHNRTKVTHNSSPSASP